MAMTLTIDGFGDGDPIPETFAFCAAEGMGDNRNPALTWNGAPEGTRSFAVLCVDGDAPTDPTNVNKPGVTVPADLPRAEFAHWVLVDVDAATTAIAEGSLSDGITAHGKPTGADGVGVAGANDYTSWFAGDADMEGTYGGYDGPCPPSNDELVHHYRFEVVALDVESLDLEGDFGLAEARAAMEGHVLDSVAVVGTYTLNPGLR